MIEYANEFLPVMLVGGFLGLGSLGDKIVGGLTGLVKGVIGGDDPVGNVQIEAPIGSASSPSLISDAGFFQDQLDRLKSGVQDFLEGVVGGGVQGAASAAESGGTTAKSSVILDSNTILIGALVLVAVVFAIRSR